MNRKDISVVITSFNEATNIGRCLDSAAGYGQILLVDSFSTDDTVAVAREYSVTIFRRPYLSAAAQKNWAIERARYEWVLVLDADEALTDSLRAEIARLDPKRLEGFWIRRRSDYLGKPIRGCGWQRDKVLRLFRRASGRYHDAHVHEEVVLAGKAGRLTEPMLHRPYRDIGQHFDKIEEYSTRGAQDYVERGGRFALFNMVLHPPMRFLRMYFWQRGFIDGVRGLTLCLLASYSVFLKYAKAWELGRWQKSR